MADTSKVDKLEETFVPQANVNDPLLVIEIVEEPCPKVLSEIMYFNPGPGKDPIAYAPVFDKYDFAHFKVRRDYGERLLANQGGRVFRLYYPHMLTIRVPNNQFGTDLKTIFSWKVDVEEGTGKVRLIEREETEVKALLRGKEKA